MRPRTAGGRGIARVGLRLLGGWAFVGEVPIVPKAVIAAAPHTSNLDGLLMLLLTRSQSMGLDWLIKDSWQGPPLGGLLRRLGAVFIDRDAPGGFVEQMITEFGRREHMHLMIPPEGTRKRAEYWKSGFYRIALGAGVPVVPAFMDYDRKQGGFGDPITLTGDRAADMEKLRAFFAEGPRMARHSEKFGPVRLRTELADADVQPEDANESENEGPQSEASDSNDKRSG